MPVLQSPHVKDPDDHDVLWRYVDFPTFVSTMLRKRLRFARMDSFPDRWEGILRRVEKRALRSGNTDVILGTTSSVTGDLDTPERKQSVAICWCRSPFENAMFWDLYRADHLGIALVTTARRLRSLLEASSWKIWFGTVQYIDVRGFDATETTVPARLFLKDRSFAPESEVRAVRFTAGVEAAADGEFLDVPLTAGLFQVRVLVHPAAPKWFALLVKEVLANAGFDDAIEQSSLGGTVSGLSIDIGGPAPRS